MPREISVGQRKEQLKGKLDIVLRKEAKHIIVHIALKHLDKDQDQEETNLIN